MRPKAESLFYNVVVTQLTLIWDSYLFWLMVWTLFICEQQPDIGELIVSFLYKSNIPYVREVSRSGYGITGAYGKPATLMEGG